MLGRVYTCRQIRWDGPSGLALGGLFATPGSALKRRWKTYPLFQPPFGFVVRYNLGAQELGKAGVGAVIALL